MPADSADVAPQNVVARVATEDDAPFLRNLFFEIRAPEFAPAQLSPEQLAALLDQQYAAMKLHYGRVFPDAVYWVLECDGTPVGYEVIREGRELHLIDIAVLPTFQNRGIGTRRMQALLNRGLNCGKSIFLSVEIFNPAQRLYERLGFRDYEQIGIYKRMRWSPVTAST